MDRLVRWALNYQRFSFDIVHRAGKLNVVAFYALSRDVVNTIDTVDWYNTLTKIFLNSFQIQTIIERGK